MNKLYFGLIVSLFISFALYAEGNINKAHHVARVSSSLKSVNLPLDSSNARKTTSNERGTGGIVNNSGKIVIRNSGYVVIANQGNYTTSGTGYINNNGTVILSGDFVNNNTAGNAPESLTSGTIQTTKDLADITSVNVAGLGAEITTTANMGSTTITRGHTAQTGAGNTGIKRYYDIAPASNTGLDATLVFHYDDGELNELTESGLILFKSTDGGTTWSNEGGIVDTDNNTITLSNIDGFSRWTASDSDHTLPVTLSTFTAQYLNNTPTLYWSTQSEIDNMGWFVYRNEENDFTTSEKISEFIEGHGTTTQQQSYIYEDQIENPEVDDTYYYWLESIDYSGMVNHYDKVAILTIPDQHDPGSGLVPVPERYGLFQNEPNPVISTTHIAFNLNNMSQVKLDIYNLKGQLVKSLYSGMTTSQSLAWDGSDNTGQKLSAGVYLYKLIVNGKTEDVKKLILMKLYKNFCSSKVPIRPGRDGEGSRQ